MTEVTHQPLNNRKQFKMAEDFHGMLINQHQKRLHSYPGARPLLFFFSYRSNIFINFPQFCFYSYFILPVISVFPFCSVLLNCSFFSIVSYPLLMLISICLAIQQLILVISTCLSVNKISWFFLIIYFFIFSFSYYFSQKRWNRVFNIFWYSIYGSK